MLLDALWPRFLIPREQLEYLVENHFSVPKMAEIIGVSPRTIERRMAECEISISSQYADITDEQLDEVVQAMYDVVPACGYRQMQGLLLGRGLRVQQHRVRDAVRRVDPMGTLLCHLHHYGQQMSI